MSGEDNLDGMRTDVSEDNDVDLKSHHIIFKRVGLSFMLERGH